MSTEHADWKVLREEITAQALAACEKFQSALGTANEPPPLELGEALEDVANEYLNLFDAISELHRRKPRLHNVSSIGA
jgi:hypothetical protein